MRDDTRDKDDGYRDYDLVTTDFITMAVGIVLGCTVGVIFYGALVGAVATIAYATFKFLTGI